MKLERVALAELRPLEKNVRIHNPKQIAELQRSVKAFGQTRAIVIDEANSILVGNGLHQAMVAMGQEAADCYRVVGLTEADKKRLVLADNKTFQLGADEYDTIAEYLKELGAQDIYDVPGYDSSAIAALIRDSDQILQDMVSYDSPPMEPTQDYQRSCPPVASPSPVQFPAQEAEPRASVSQPRQVACPKCGHEFGVR